MTSPFLLAGLSSLSDDLDPDSRLAVARTGASSGGALFCVASAHASFSVVFILRVLARSTGVSPRSSVKVTSAPRCRRVTAVRWWSL